MKDEWPIFPVLKLLRNEDEPLRVLLVDSIRKNWSTLEKMAQFLYDDNFSQAFDDEGPTLQVRLPLPVRDSTGEQRFFSGLLQWGAPLEAWGDEDFDSGEEPEATVEIYEAEGLGWLREVARFVVRSNDLHVKMNSQQLLQ